MAFDPTSAAPDTGFDANSAQPVSGFDPTSAQPVDTSAADIKAGGQITDTGGNGNLFGPGGRVDRLGHLIHGEFESGVMNGFGGLVAREGYKLAGVPADRVNAAVLKARQDAQDEITNAQSNGFNPAGTAANLIGGVDPTWLINPGTGVAKSLGLQGAARVATHIATNAATHAALGSATDAAYQGADIIDGLQKDFDVKRNLTAAASMGALGAGATALGEAAPVVSDFVAGLFKDRGVDTLPSADPKGLTTPLTGQGLSPEETEQYHQVLQSGDESDIHNFFDGRNVTPPSHADIHEWVGRRDAVDQNIAPSDYADPMFHPEPGPVDNRGPVQEHIANETANWKNAPEFEVINHTDDIQDPQVRDAAVKAQADSPDSLGFVGPDSKVRIFANKITSGDELNAVLYHEALGHYGLAQQFGDRLDATIQTLLKRNVGQFGKDVDQWVKDNPGAYNGDRTRAAEEVLAEQSQNGVIKPSVSDALTAHVRNFGRKMGLKLSYSDAEVRNILAMAHDAVVNGKKNDVAGNGFRYMFTGERATNFDPESATAYRATDGDLRNEISDKGAVLNDDVLQGENRTTLGEALHHPALYEEYPHLRDVHVVATPMDIHGAYSPETKRMYINSNGTEKLQTILHEVQHAVQDHEDRPGIDRDGMALSSDEYDKDPLENEARATEDRRDLTDAERAATQPKFMKRTQLAVEPETYEGALEETYRALDKDYVPTTRPFAETRRMALEAGIKPSQIADLGDSKNLDVKITRMAAAAQMTRMKIADLNEKLDSPDWSMRDKSDYLQAVADYGTLLARIRDNRAEYARALNVSKAIGYTRKAMGDIGDVLQAQGGSLTALADHDTFLKFARGVKNMMNNGNPAGANVMLQAVNKPYWEQYLLTWHQNAILSGLSTHLKSPMDMATSAGRDVMDKIASLPLATIRLAAQSAGLNVKSGVHPTEVAAHIWGLMRSAIEAASFTKGTALKDAADALINGQHQSGRYGNIQNPRIAGISKVTDLVSAQDTFFRSFLMNANLYALHAREAYQSLKAASNTGHVNWDDVMTMAAAGAHQPGPAMLKAATDLTEHTILLNRPPLNSAIEKARLYTPGMSPGERSMAFALNVVAPIIRVPMNALVNQFVRRSPLALLDQATRKQLMAGGAEADIAMMKMLVGTASIATYWSAAGQKKTTGEGPDNTNKLKEMEASGWTSNAVHENGRYNKNSNLNISLNPFDLHNNTATMVAGIREAYEKGSTPGQAAQGLKLAVLSMMSDLSNQTFLGDLGPAIDAVTARGTTTEQKIGRFVGEEAKSFVPNIVNQLVRVADPESRDTRSDTLTGQITNQVKSALPGLDQTLPVRYNVYGEPMKNGATLEGLHTWLGHGNGQEEVQDPTEKELSRLATTSPAAIVTAPQSSMNVNGAKIKLTPAQFEDYQKYAGQTTVQAVRSLMNNGTWQQMSDRDRIIQVRSIQKEAKSDVKMALLQKEGWLNSDQLTNLRTQLNGQ